MRTVSGSGTRGTLPAEPCKPARLGFFSTIPCLLSAQISISDSDYKHFLFWGVVLVVGMLVLFIVQRVVRYGVQSRISSIHRELGMRPEDLDRMAKSGLLSEEEKKRVQESIARNLSRETQEALRRKAEGKKSAEEILASSLGPDSRPGGDAVPRTTEAGRTNSSHAVESTREEGRPERPSREVLPLPRPEKPEARTSRAPAVDLDSLLARGLITPEEYKRLRESGEDD